MSLPPCAVFDIIVRIDCERLFHITTAETVSMTFEDRFWKLVFEQIQQPPQNWMLLLRHSLSSPPDARMSKDFPVPVSSPVFSSSKQDSPTLNPPLVENEGWKHSPPSSIEEMKGSLLEMKQKMLLLVDDCYWWLDQDHTHGGAEKAAQLAVKEDFETFVRGIVRGEILSI